MAKHKRKSGKGRGLGEIKRQGRRRTQAQKASYRSGSPLREITVKARIWRDRGAIGSKREGDYSASVCIPTKKFVVGRFKRMQRSKKGHSGRCGDGGGRTPTAALRSAFKQLGKNLE